MKLSVRDILWAIVVCATLAAWMRDNALTTAAHDHEIIALQHEREEARGDAIRWESQADSLATVLRWDGYNVRLSKDGFRVDSPSLLYIIIDRLTGYELPEWLEERL